MNRVVRALVLMVGVSLLAAACSDAKKTDTSVGGALSTAAAPEDLRASAADVASGLQKIESTAKQIASTAGTDKTKAKELAGELEPVWKTIEGTVKANDPDSYIAFEDAFALLETAADDGDGTKAQQGAGSVSSTVASYLAKYPG